MARIAPLNPPYTPDIQAAFDAIMPAGVDPLVLCFEQRTSHHTLV
jgi:hypothetical protein